MDVVDRHRLADELRLVVPALREQRPDRAVDHPRGQGRLLPGARLAAEERAGDLARGVVLLLDVDRQRQEVDVAQVAGGRGARAPSCRPSRRRPLRSPDGRACRSRRRSPRRRSPPRRGSRQTCSCNCYFLSVPRLATPLLQIFAVRMVAGAARPVRSAHDHGIEGDPAIGRSQRASDGSDRPASAAGDVAPRSSASAAATSPTTARRARRPPASGTPPDPLEVAPHPRGDRVGAPVALEALEVEAEALDPLPQVRVVDVALVGVDRVAHLPEAALRARPPRRRRGAPARARACSRPGSGGRRAAAAAPGSAPRSPRSAGSRGPRRRSPRGPRRGRGRRARPGGPRRREIGHGSGCPRPIPFAGPGREAEEPAGYFSRRVEDQVRARESRAASARRATTSPRRPRRRGRASGWWCPSSAIQAP